MLSSGNPALVHSSPASPGVSCRLSYTHQHPQPFSVLCQLSVLLRAVKVKLSVIKSLRNFKFCLWHQHSPFLWSHKKLTIITLNVQCQCTAVVNFKNPHNAECSLLNPCLKGCAECAPHSVPGATCSFSILCCILLLLLPLMI